MVVPLESGPRKWRRSTHNNLVMDYWEEGGGLKVKKVKVVDFYSVCTRSVSKPLRYSTHCQGIKQFYLHTLRFICKWNELYLRLPLPSQP